MKVIIAEPLPLFTGTCEKIEGLRVWTDFIVYTLDILGELPTDVLRDCLHTQEKLSCTAGKAILPH